MYWKEGLTLPKAAELKEKNHQIEELANEYRQLWRELDDHYEARINQYFPKLKQLLDNVKGQSSEMQGVLNLLEYKHTKFLHIKTVLRSVLSPDTNLPTNISSDDDRYTYIINIAGENALNAPEHVFKTAMDHLTKISTMTPAEIQLAQKIDQYETWVDHYRRCLEKINSLDPNTRDL